jgi:hypothetical protein
VSVLTASWVGYYDIWGWSPGENESGVKVNFFYSRFKEGGAPCLAPLLLLYLRGAVRLFACTAFTTLTTLTTHRVRSPSPRYHSSHPPRSPRYYRHATPARPASRSGSGG